MGGRIDRWRRLAPILGVGLLAIAWAAPANAQEDGDSATSISLRAVDARSQGITAFVSTPGGLAGLDSIVVRENGEDVDASVAASTEAGFTSDVLFVVDTSTTTDANAMLAEAKDALDAVIADLPDGTRAAIVAAGSASQTLRSLSADSGRLGEAIEDLTPTGEGALFSGLVRAANLVREGTETVPSVVLITDGVVDSTTPIENAKTQLVEAGAPLFVVGLQDGGLDEGLIGGLANDTNGRMVITDDATEIAGLVEEIAAEVTDVGVLQWESSAGAGVQDLELTLGEMTVSASYISGGFLIGAHRLVPRDPVEPGGISFFQSDFGRLLGLALAALACVMLAYVALLLFTREKTALATALEGYGDSGYVAPGEAADEGEGGFSQTAFMQRAVEMTEQFAESRGFLARVESKLERADLPLRAGEAMFFYLAGMVLVIVAVLVLAQNLMAVLVVGLLVALIPPAILNFLSARKKRQFEALLPDTLQLLSSTLRAGYSMMQGIEAVSVEAAEPMGKELRKVVTEARLGRPLEESLDAIAERMDSPDFAWAVMAIRIQREVGGNLSELLMTVAETMTERERLRRDVNSLTAEGRISAYVLIALPVGLGLFLWSVNPDYIGQLFDVTLGQVMLAGSIVGIIGGYAWMMKIIKIEI